MLLFQQRLVGQGNSIVSLFPSLKEIALYPTFDGITMPMPQLRSFLIRFMDNSECDNQFWYNYIKTQIDDATEPSELNAFSLQMPPKAQYDLNTLLGETPAGFTLDCTQFPLPRSLAAFDGIKLGQCNSPEGKDARVLKESNIKSFEIDEIYLEGCIVGNSFTNSSLLSLPASLETLSLQGSPRFQMPCKSLRRLTNLRHLKLEEVDWKAQTISTHLPAGLKSYHIGIDTKSLEDGRGFNFKSIDVSDLPAGLEKFSLILGDYEYDYKYDEIKITGSLPSSLKKLRLSMGSFPPFPPSLTTLDIAFPRSYGAKSKLPRKRLDLEAMATAVGPSLQKLIIRVGRDSAESVPLIQGDLFHFVALTRVKCDCKNFLATLQHLARFGNVQFSIVSE
jgi:hypothetical protein